LALTLLSEHNGFGILPWKANRKRDEITLRNSLTLVVNGDSVSITRARAVVLAEEIFCIVQVRGNGLGGLPAHEQIANEIRRRPFELLNSSVNQSVSLVRSNAETVLPTNTAR
jgi:hypothetical protein